jgi:hypothetical protein
MPKKGTKCVGPITTARLIQLQHRRLPKAADPTRVRVLGVRSNDAEVASAFLHRKGGEKIVDGSP